jgi:NAD(P)-dependent dehydrogenase (short-subunit alcohol dehydrogenase family)
MTPPRRPTAVVFRADLPVGRGVVERLGASHRVIAIGTEPGRRDAWDTVPGATPPRAVDVLVLPPPPERQPSATRWSADVRAGIDEPLRQTYFSIQHAVPHMTGGRIVVAAPPRDEASPPVPTVLEGALTALVRLLAVELAPLDIAVNAVCPTGPDVTAGAVADALAFLASDEASYLTGAALPLLRNGPRRPGARPPEGPLARTPGAG